jgi:flagellar basal body-associated protein FliL
MLASLPVQPAIMKKPAPTKKAAPGKKGSGKGTGAPENMIAYISIALVMFAVSAALAWFYLRAPAPPAPTSTYTKIGPVNFRVGGQSARVTMDLQQAVNVDPNWAKQNYGALETVIESVLSETDQATMAAPNAVKLPQIQKRLTAALHKNFPQAKVKDVFVTDYVSAEN